MSEALDFITIRGFRSIAAIEKFELSPLNVLIGANGCGKSNFLEAFSFLREVRDGRLQHAVAKKGGANRLLHFGRKTTEAVEFELSFAEGTNGYRVRLSATDDDRLHPDDESIAYDDRRDSEPPFRQQLTPREPSEAGISDPELAGVGEWVRLRLGMWTTYHFHDTSNAAPLRQTASLNDNRRLHPDGRNLPAFLYLLQQVHPAAYRQIQHAVRQVMPFFDDFALAPLALSPDTIRLQWRHRNSDQDFDVSALSDGSLRFVALATLLLQPAELRPRIILIDEPELGLHPAAITLLGSMLEMATQTAQVIVSTQSSLLLDHCPPESVVVAEQNNGATTLRRLETDALTHWLEDYSLGQLWEKNELGGRP